MNFRIKTGYQMSVKSQSAAESVDLDLDQELNMVTPEQQTRIECVLE